MVVMEVRHLFLPRLIVVMHERTKLAVETEPREFTCTTIYVNDTNTEITVPLHSSETSLWQSAVFHSPRSRGRSVWRTELANRVRYKRINIRQGHDTLCSLVRTVAGAIACVDTNINMALDTYFVYNTADSDGGETQRTLAGERLTVVCRGAFVPGAFEATPNSTAALATKIVISVRHRKGDILSVRVGTQSSNEYYAFSATCFCQPCTHYSVAFVWDRAVATGCRQLRAIPAYGGCTPFVYSRRCCQHGILQP